MLLFTLFYYLTALLLYLLALPFLPLAALSPKYRRSLPARFFLWRNPPFSKDGVWFHACSVGEVAALAPIIEETQGVVNLSVITQTGFERAAQYGKEVRYLPYEIWLPFWVHHPRVLVVMEAELWYMLFWSAKRRGAKTLLINARISDRSWPKYRRFSLFYRFVFAQIDKVFAQSEKDARRLRALGAKEVVVAGNIKAAAKIEARTRLQKPAKRVITLASTHKGEEALLLAHLDLRGGETLLVVPRHPERFSEVESMLKAYAKSHRKSFGRWSEREDFSKDIVLIDRMGLLVDLYAISDIVFLGGSFVEDVGGHNPLEPARFGCRILSGPWYFNQQPLYETVEGIDLIGSEELPNLRERMERAKRTAIRGQLGTEMITKEIACGMR